MTGGASEVRATLNANQIASIKNQLHGKKKCNRKRHLIEPFTDYRCALCFPFNAGDCVVLHAADAQKSH